MDKVDELLTRGVDTVYPTKETLEKVLRSGKKLTLYQGFDPTGIQMHIGHMVGLRKLAQFQKLGHKVIFLIGDGTGLAGDPSGKTRARDKFLSRGELRQNARDYVQQASKIVNFEGENPIEIRYNGDWLTKLTLQDLLEIAGNFTLQQLEERDLFEKRKKEGLPINMREFMYPLLQGYDSVAMEVDLEIGGSDQMFNMLAGRTLVQICSVRRNLCLLHHFLQTKKAERSEKQKEMQLLLMTNRKTYLAKSWPCQMMSLSKEWSTSLIFPWKR